MGTDLRPGTLQLDGASVDVTYFGLVQPHLRGLMRELTSLHVPAALRRQGKGTALMREVCRIADAEGVTLLVKPDPFDDGPTDMNQTGLSRWYAGYFGFWTLQHEPLVMIRLPFEAQPSQALKLTPIAAALRPRGLH